MIFFSHSTSGGPATLSTEQAETITSPQLVIYWTYTIGAHCLELGEPTWAQFAHNCPPIGTIQPDGCLFWFGLVSGEKCARIKALVSTKRQRQRQIERDIDSNARRVYAPQFCLLHLQPKHSAQGPGDFRLATTSFATDRLTVSWNI